MAILIVFFTYFYTSIIFNPVDLAENLKKQGGFIPGVKPGAKTAEYIDDVVSKITLPGALFLDGRSRCSRSGSATLIEHAVLLRRHVAAHRRRRGARHGAADAAAPAAAALRRLHEEGPCTLPRAAGSSWRVLDQALGTRRWALRIGRARRSAGLFFVDA